MNDDTVSNKGLLNGAAAGETEPEEGAQSSSQDSDKVKLKKELGLLDGVALIVGIIVGSGIFVSPKGVLQKTGSIAVSLIVWVVCGFLTMIGSLCYAELGTMIPKSGADYSYLGEAYGPLPAFLYLWAALLIIMPTGNAIISLTFASYVLQPLWPSCDPPDTAVRLIAAAVICFLTFINCYNVKLATKVTDIFTGTKVLALGIIIVVGMYALAINPETESFQHPWEGTNKDPRHIAVAFYSGMFSYGGWNYLNFVTEELKNPYKNLPRAIWISMPTVVIIYMLANVAYYTVLTKEEVLASSAVAVTFAQRAMGPVSWIMPVFVACSTFGSLNSGIFTAARLCFVGARNGQLPDFLAFISVKNYTPIPSLLFLCSISLLMLCISDIYKLINYTSFVESSFFLACVAAVLYLRWKRPDLHRPIKVNLLLPITFFIICAFLVILPVWSAPYEVGAGVVILLSGVVIYLIFLRTGTQPRFIKRATGKVADFVQKLFMAVKQEH